MKLYKKSDRQFIVTVPKRLVSAKMWKAGDILDWTINSRGDLTLIKRKIWGESKKIG
jgi:bifunctional DNA-binding transcriptional regulator/antitoxin component of YhaV-PrlF toxin-antitoxin module